MEIIYTNVHIEVNVEEEVNVITEFSVEEENNVHTCPYMYFI